MNLTTADPPRNLQREKLPIIEKTTGDESSATYSSAAPAIVVDDLVKRYASADRNAVDGVSFSVQPGQFFALLGPNGAGKTTIISILTTTLQPTSGAARIAGHDVVREASRVRASAGIIFQQPSLDLNLTAEENVRFHAILYGLYPFRPAFRLMPREYQRHIGELAEVLGLSNEMFQPIRTFSGGMKRKLEILRSLIHRPRILFLDEPTTGLDPSSRRSLWAYLDDVRASSGTTLFLSTHYLEEAERTDELCIVNKGKVVASGSPRSVKSQLVERFMLIDADDRATLLKELDDKGIRYTVDGHVRVDAAGAAVHELLKRIETPLVLVETHSPTLEDAYLEVIDYRDAVLEAGEQDSEQ